LTAAHDHENHHDLDLLNTSLELAVAQCEDLAPAVFARFFARCPAATALFTVPDAAMPPLGCGQMVFEIISLLLDSAAGKPYVAPYMHQIASEHCAFKVEDATLYPEFMASLVDVLAGLLGTQWSPAYAQAWERQSRRLLDSLPTRPLACLAKAADSSAAC
jgi:hemoglobin-like flavoprotein